jgi:hypothetical protein
MLLHTNQPADREKKRIEGIARRNTARGMSRGV